MHDWMTAFVLGVLLALPALTGASAQQKGDFCLTGGTTGQMDCSYQTLAQCEAAKTGSITESCVRNPNSTSGIPAPSPR